jgi:hypothetical protein
LGSTLQNYDYSIFSVNPGKKNQSNPLDLTQLVKLIVYRAGQETGSSQLPSNTLPASSSAGSSENEQILNEYRSLYPSYFTLGNNNTKSLPLQFITVFESVQVLLN